MFLLFSVEIIATFVVGILNPYRWKDLLDWECWPWAWKHVLARQHRVEALLIGEALLEDRTQGSEAFRAHLLAQKDPRVRTLLEQAGSFFP